MSFPAYFPDFASAASQPWSSDRDETLRCIQIRQESHDVKSFVLACDTPRQFRYLPGQFITLTLEIEGQTLNRCYTLSSTPTRPDTLSITVKRVAGGTVSNWLHDHLRVGMSLGVLGPSGDFTCFPVRAKQYLLISGGSGITPLMSMARALQDLGSHADVVFVHCARTPADVLFGEELSLMARNMPHFRVAIVCERHTAGSSYAGHLGRIDASRLAHIAPDFMARSVYTCGPAPFMGAVRTLLERAGFDMARYSQESFSFEEAVAPTSTIAVQDDPRATTLHTITLKKTAQSFACAEDQTILQAAMAAGVRLPSSCSSGACGTCKSLCLSGKVHMQHAGGIRQREIDQGWVLPCCARPLGDVSLDR